MSDVVREILGNYIYADTDAGELSRALNAVEPPPWRDRFRTDLAAAIRSGDLDPDTAGDIMDRDFADRETYERWMRDAWAQWFPGVPYPA